MRVNTIVCFVVAAMLLLCLLDMPYGYYVLVRFVAAAAFAYLALVAYNEGEKMGRMILMIALCALFQPFFKLALGREIWNVVDVIVAGYLAYLGVKMLKE